MDQKWLTSVSFIIINSTQEPRIRTQRRRTQANGWNILQMKIHSIPLDVPIPCDKNVRHAHAKRQAHTHTAN